MEVTRVELEASLSALTANVGDRLAGIHGPSTLAWHHGRELANFIGAGRAVLMQLAHPPVAAAIAEHSKTFVDLRGRFERTFSIVFAMTFGDLDQAVDSARRLHRIHTYVRGNLANGHAYAANAKPSLRWVYATLIDSIFAVRRLCGVPLSAEACESYYQETKRFALLFGLGDDDLPRSHRDFELYVERSCDGAMTSATDGAPQMARALLEAPHVLLSPLATRFQAVTAALLPERLCRVFSLEDHLAERGTVKRQARMLFHALGSSPAQVRFFPPYLDALARLGLRCGSVRHLDRLAARLIERKPSDKRASR